MAQTVVRTGMPPTESIPAIRQLALASLSGGITPDDCVEVVPHDAGVPPLLPAQDQDHGPVPVIDEAKPTEHSPVVGAVLAATPLAGPH